MEFDLDLELDKKYVTACCPVVYTGQVGTFQFRFLGTDAFSSENSRSLHPGPGPGEEVPGFLKLTEGGSLNLTCEVADVDSRDPEPAVTLSWYLPNHFVERKR